MGVELRTRMKTSPTVAITPVRSLLLQRKCACQHSAGMGGECDACRVQRGGVSQSSAISHRFDGEVPPIVGEVLASSGQPLDSSMRAVMEPRFGHDFSRVRVHTNARGAESARSVNALAYTVGRDIVFGAGHYAPGTTAGNQLIAHELTHVVQQSSAEPSRAGAGVTQTGPRPILQRMKFGESTPPEMDGKKVEVVPDEERPLLNQVIKRLAEVANDPVGFARCHEFFADECAGDKDTLKKTFDAARLWKWPPGEPHLGGALANTPGTNIAYMQSSYRKGVDVLADFLMHELVHNCGGGAGGDPRHRQADVARVYCMGGGKNEFTPKVAVDLDKNVNLIFSYRRLVHEWLSGRLQLTVGTDIGVTGLLRLGQTGQQAAPAELVSGTLGARRRFNIWGAERFGGLVLSADLGVGLDRFKVRAPTPNDKPSHAVGPGVVLQLGARVEFWIPSATFKEGRVTPLHFDVGVQLAEPLTPDAERLHSFIFGIGGAF